MHTAFTITGWFAAGLMLIWATSEHTKYAKVFSDNQQLYTLIDAATSELHQANDVLHRCNKILTDEQLKGAL